MKILTVVGARPQFIKAAMFSRAVLQHRKEGLGPKVEEDIIHTGQHYDANMSHIFFEDMQIPKPAANLSVGSGSHGQMTGRMLAELEREMLDRKPDYAMVYGDTNSTLAAALAASKLQIPVIHVEAGLRSFNRAMPEEINRVLTDHVSDLLFCPTHAAIGHLKTEGIATGVHHVGDVMYDAAQVFGQVSKTQSTILQDLKLEPGHYHLATVHRAENTDHRDRLAEILSGLSHVGQTHTVVLPLHPRTAKCIQTHQLEDHCKHIRTIDPVSFLDMISLEKNARTILTDSGGVQKEAYFHGVPCITMRTETEWIETVEAGWNQLVAADRNAIATAVENAQKGQPIAEYGSGQAAQRILDLILEHRKH